MAEAVRCLTLRMNQFNLYVLIESMVLAGRVFATCTRDSWIRRRRDGRHEVSKIIAMLHEREACILRYSTDFLCCTHILGKSAVCGPLHSDRPLG
jgi:hypothetical protein